MFMVWLMEQEDRDDNVAVLQKALFKDYNNGCLPTLSNLKGVLTHYLDKHPVSFVTVREQFIEALRAYDKESKQ